MTKSRKDLAKEAVRKYVSLLADITLSVAAEKLLEQVICAYLPDWPTDAEITEIVRLNDNKFAAGFNAGVRICQRRQSNSIIKGIDLAESDE